MSQRDTKSSGPTEGPTTIERYDLLTSCKEAISYMLREKEQQYGRAGGFYETNKDDYSHAIGEAVLKLREFQTTKNPRMLVKALTWIYLIYETEALRGPK